MTEQVMLEGLIVQIASLKTVMTSTAMWWLCPRDSNGGIFLELVIYK